MDSRISLILSTAKRLTSAQPCLNILEYIGVHRMSWMRVCPLKEHHPEPPARLEQRSWSLPTQAIRIVVHLIMHGYDVHVECY